MSVVSVNGILLAYERNGGGEPVFMIMGTGASGNVWRTYQVPALNGAGYQTITFDNRGVPPSDAPPGDYSLGELVADAAGLIEALDAGPCRVVGTSMGAIIATELAVIRPDLVRSCVLMATRARADATRRALSVADKALADSGVHLPPGYDGPTSVVQMFSPTTLNDDAKISPWLELFEMSAGRRTVAAGQAAVDLNSDRRRALRTVRAPCRVIAFSDDLICPPHLGAEVAEAIPDCDLVEISDCGHLGYLERPREVNQAIIEFLDKT